MLTPGHEGTVSRAAHLATKSGIWVLMCRGPSAPGTTSRPLGFPICNERSGKGQAGGPVGVDTHQGPCRLAAHPPSLGLRTGRCPVLAAELGYQYWCTSRGRPLLPPTPPKRPSWQPHSQMCPQAPRRPWPPSLNLEASTQPALLQEAPSLPFQSS